MRFALAARTLALLLGLAGLVACESQLDPYFPVDGVDASVASDGSAPADASLSDRTTSSTLSDGRVVTGERPFFHWYSRDSWYLDVATFQAVHSLTLIRSDGAIVAKGCTGTATPAQLASFEAVATDLATLEALEQTTPCGVGDVGDDVTVSYVARAPLKHAAACDPQLQMLTGAGTALIQAVCPATADGGTDAP